MKFRACSLNILQELQIETTTPIRAIHTTIPAGKGLEEPGSVGKPSLVLIRGLSGSGKSTLAHEFVKAGFRHFEADRYFVKNGVWILDKTKIPEAHIWCKNLVTRTLDFGQSVVVSNTFPKLIDLRPYFKLAKSALIVETAGEWQNIHDVTDDGIKRMKKKWESL